MKVFIRSFLILIAGIVLGWGISVLNEPVAGESRDGDKADAFFGVNLFYGAEARRLAADAGITIPTNAMDSFYGIGGFKPVFEFIAFTVPKQEAWPFITSISGKKKSDIRMPFGHFKAPSCLERVIEQSYLILRVSCLQTAFLGSLGNIFMQIVPWMRLADGFLL
jgi:hypothetical protein